MEVGYTTSVIDYTHAVARHTELSDGKYVRHLPVNSISGANMIEFVIPPTEEYIHPQECYVKITIKVTKPDGDNLDDEDVVAPSDNVLGSLFKAVTLYMNSVRITHSNVFQALENYFVTRYGIGKQAADIHMKEIQGLTGEAAGQNDSKNAHAVGWSQRKLWIAESKEYTVMGLIPCDFFGHAHNLFHLFKTFDLSLN